MGIRQEAERLNSTTLDELDKIAETLDKTAKMLGQKSNSVDMLGAEELYVLAVKIKNITRNFTHGGG